MHQLVSVVIVTCGRNDYYLSCLEAVCRQTHAALDIILVNNSFDPAVSRQALAVCASLRVYSPEQNLFYAEAMNKGLAMSRGDFVLCLNDDVFLDIDFIAEALKGFAVDQTIGLVSGKILRLDRKTLDSTGLFLSVWRTARERGYGQGDRGQFDSEGFIFGVSGAAAFYRKKMLEDIREAAGWFDPVFRMFYEDLDLSWRANRAGWKAYYIPAAQARHVRGGSVRSGKGADRPFARRYLDDDLHADLIKNRYLTIIKNETLPGFIIHLLPMVLYDIGSWGYILISRPGVIRIFFGRWRWPVLGLRWRCAGRGIK